MGDETDGGEEGKGEGGEEGKILAHGRTDGTDQPKVQGASKKTSFCENGTWQILVLIMKNPPSFSLTNAGDLFCNSYTYYLAGLHIEHWQSDIFSPPATISFYFSKCPPRPRCTSFHCTGFKPSNTCICKSSLWTSLCQQ